MLAAYERHKAKAPWTVGPVMRYLAAHPSPEAKKKHAELEAALFGPREGEPKKAR